MREEAKEAAETYKEKKFDEGKPSDTEEPLEMQPKEPPKQKASEFITSFKERRVVEIRKESEKRKIEPEENEKGEDRRYVIKRKCSINYYNKVRI